MVWPVFDMLKKVRHGNGFSCEMHYKCLWSEIQLMVFENYWFCLFLICMIALCMIAGFMYCCRAIFGYWHKFLTMYNLLHRDDFTFAGLVRHGL